MASNGKRNIDMIDLTGDDNQDSSRQPQQKSTKAGHSDFPRSQRLNQGLDFLSSSQSSRNRRGIDRNVELSTSLSQGAATPMSQSAPTSSQNQDWSPPNTQAVMEDEARAADLVLGSQDFDDGDYENYEFYGIYELSIFNQLLRLCFSRANGLVDTLQAKIVGIRFYSGQATPGEYVAVRREPSNRYDSNAIRVDNVMGAQIGHIPRFLASKLASYMVGPSSQVFR